MPKWNKRPRPGRLNPVITEREAEYLEKTLQPEILAANETLAEDEKKRTRIFQANAVFCLFLPGDVEIIPVRAEDRLTLVRQTERILELWLNPDDERRIGIGSHDYYLRRDGRLVEVESRLLDLVARRKPGAKDYALAREEEGRFILDIRIIEGNERIVQFFAK